MVQKKKKTNKKKDSKGEIECRRVLEMIYRVPFKKSKPEFLRTPDTKKCLELDGYNKELKIAFEYNGDYHYIYPHYFTKDELAFHRRIQLDKYKKEVCKKMGIHLISIPFTVFTGRIEAYIKERLP